MSTLHTDSAWIPVALSDGLPRGGVMRVETAGRDLAVWRAHDGRVNCVDNRCPHRGMRLSFGFVRGNRLNCIYHGWQYATNGQCKYIPAHPELEPPASLCVATLNCCEDQGLIWIALDPSDRRESSPSHRCALRSLAVNRGVHKLLASLRSRDLPIRVRGPRGCSARLLHSDHTELQIALERSHRPLPKLVLSLQSVNENKTWLHAQFQSGCEIEDKICASRWLESLRRHLEAQA